MRDQQQILQSKLAQSTDIMSFLTEFKEIIVRRANAKLLSSHTLST
jgi:hypothetical protein